MENDSIVTSFVDIAKERARRKRHFAATDDISGPTAESVIDEGEVNYAKFHNTQHPNFGSGKAKWRQSSIVKKSSEMAGELGSHNGGSSHVSMPRQGTDKLAVRQDIHNANPGRDVKTFAIKQTRNPVSKTKANLPESFKELVEGNLQELSRGGLSNYISAAKGGAKDRSTGVALAQKKKWGDKKFGFEEPKVKATESVVANSAAIFENADRHNQRYLNISNESKARAEKFKPGSDDHSAHMSIHHATQAAYHRGVGNYDKSDDHLAKSKELSAKVKSAAFHDGSSSHWNSSY